MNVRMHIAAIALVSTGICLLTLILSSVGASASAADNTSQVVASKHAAFSAGVANDESDSAARWRRRWKAGTIQDVETRKFKATVTDRKSGDSYCWGSYDTKEEAQSEATRVGNNLNASGFIGAPECNVPPGWLNC